VKLQLLEFHDLETGVRAQSWHSSKDEASKARTELRKLHSAHRAGLITQVDVPTTKLELIDWLNGNASRRV